MLLLFLVFVLEILFVGDSLVAYYRCVIVISIFCGDFRVDINVWRIWILPKTYKSISKTVMLINKSLR